jgi:hypothetical protein
MQSSVHRTDLRSSRAADLGAPYGSSVLHMLQSSVHCMDHQFFTCCSPRCTVRTISSLHTAVLGALYGPSFLHMLQYSVHRTDHQFFTWCSPRCTVRTISYLYAAVLGAPYVVNAFKLESLPFCAVVGIENAFLWLLYCIVKFNVQKFHSLPRQCLYVFCVDHRTNRDYFTIQH